MTPAPPCLTPREKECIELAAAGLSSAETAQRLKVADRTVEFHLRNAMRKLGASSKLRAVVLALQKRLIEL